jgi:predicted nucleic acid-binding protein
LGLIEDIGNGPVGLDTAIFIYFIEEHHRFLPVLEPLFVAIDAGLLEGVTSGLTLLETLVAPYRVGNAALANRYEALLTRSRGIRLVELDRPLLRAAARLRASTRIKAPDALQVAAALSGACPVYLTNDRGLPSVPGLRTLQLRDYLPVA